MGLARDGLTQGRMACYIFSGRQLTNDLVGCVDFGWRQHGEGDGDKVLIAVEVL